MDELSPTSLSIFVPGYEQTRIEFVERRIDLGIPEYTLELEAVARGFGSVEVTLRPVPDDIADLRVDSIARIDWTPRDGSRAFHVPVPPRDTRGALDVDHVPFGDYRAVLCAAHGLYTSPRVDVSVDASPARVHVTTAGTGSLEVHVVDGRGRPHRGWVILAIRSATGGVGSLSFDGPPFVIPFLPLGEYTVSVKRPAFRADSGPLPVRLDVAGRRDLLISGTFVAE